MLFPVVVHKDPDSEFGVSVPDIPGCVSAGENVMVALSEIQEAIQCHIEGLLIDGEPVPKANDIEVHRNDYPDAYTWGIVNIDLSKLTGKAQRVNITIPDLVLRQVDAFAEKNNLSRSSLITNAVMKVVTDAA